MLRMTVSFGLALTLLGLLPVHGVHADEIWYKDGRRIEGKIVAEEADRVQILARSGKAEIKLWVPRNQIHRIKKGPLAIDEFHERFAALEPADLAGHEQLLEWARTKELEDAARLIEEQLPEVTRLHRIAGHPRRWCRECDSHGHRDCPECKGQGTQTQTCVRCGGDKKIRCRVCGRRNRDGRLKCAQCSGAGEVERFDPAKGAKKKVKCDACKGEGIHKCPSCKGKGEQECPGCLGRGGIDKPCPRCAGEPRELCPTCKGSGLQEHQLTDEELAAEAETRKQAEEEAARKAEGGPASRPTSKPSAD